MTADVSYNDFRGNVAADISDYIGGPGNNDLKSIGKYFNLDEERFMVVGLSIYGTDNFYISLYCVDHERSTPEKEYIVSMSVDVGSKVKILDILFKRLHIVLHDRHDKKYVNMPYDDEVRYSEFHKTDND